MTLEHKEFLTWWRDQHVTIEWADEDIAHAAWQYSRKVALEDAAEAPFTLDIESYGVLPIRAAIIVSDCVKAVKELK